MPTASLWHGTTTHTGGYAVGPARWERPWALGEAGGVGRSVRLGVRLGVRSRGHRCHTMVAREMPPPRPMNRTLSPGVSVS